MDMIYFLIQEDLLYKTITELMDYFDIILIEIDYPSDIIAQFIKMIREVIRSPKIQMSSNIVNGKALEGDWFFKMSIYQLSSLVIAYN